jgi:hypothetical protein
VDSFADPVCYVSEESVSSNKVNVLEEELLDF